MVPAQPTAGKSHLSRSVLWAIAKIALALLLAAFVISQTSVDDLLLMLRRASPIWLLSAVAAFVGINVVTALRYWELVEKKIPFKSLFQVVILQGALSSFVATSAGAASYVALLRGEHRVRLQTGILSLVAARAGDLFALWVFLLSSAIVLWDQVANLRVVLLVLISAITLILGLSAAAFVGSKRAVTAIDVSLHRLGLYRLELARRSAKRLASMSAGSDSLSHRLLGSVLGYSMLIFVLSVVWAYSIMLAFAIPIDIAALVFIVSVTQLIAVIPIQVFGGLGTYDVTNMYLFGLFGVPQAMIVPALIGSRILSYAMNLGLLLYVPFKSSK